MEKIGRRRFCGAIAALGAAAAAPRAAAVGIRTREAGNGYPAIIGRQRTYFTRYEDTLLDLARAHGLGYTEIVAANPGIDPWVPGADTKIILPTAHIVPEAAPEGIVLNLADQRLYFFEPDGVSVRSAPLGIGRGGWLTPTGTTRIVRKARNPSWYVPESVRKEQPELPRVVRPGPDNPLGKHALYLGWPAYLIHGTNKPFGIGRRVSHGCVRLYPEDIAWFHDNLPIGTPVAVIDQEVKLARQSGQLFLEVHPSQSQADEIERTRRFTPSAPAELEYRILDAAGGRRDAIDWPGVRQAARERRGIPVPVLAG